MVEASRAVRVTGISPVVATAGGSVGFAGQAGAGRARRCGRGGTRSPRRAEPFPHFAARGPIRVGGELARVEAEVGGRAHHRPGLMRFDPFRQFEQIMEQNFAGTRTPRTVPMTALRRGDTFIVDLDLPGVVEDDVELTVERNVGDEVIIDERPYGEFTRQLFLGDNLDAGRMTADLRDGVLRLTIPVSEESKPRRIPLGSSGDQQPAEVSTSTG